MTRGALNQDGDRAFHHTVTRTGEREREREREREGMYHIHNSTYYYVVLYVKPVKCL